MKKKIGLLEIGFISYLIAVVLFIIFLYLQFFPPEVNALSLTLLGVVIAFVLASLSTLFLKVGRIQGRIEK